MVGYTQGKDQQLVSVKKVTVHIRFGIEQNIDMRRNMRDLDNLKNM
jgi:hypothetical protein